ncbi:Winged helix-turn helix, partial [Streptomyces yunnanensis]
MQAADLFELGMRQSKVADVLGATPQAVSLWRRAWAEGGREALLSKGSGGNSYLSAGQEAELEVLLRAGPMVHGWDDQRCEPGGHLVLLLAVGAAGRALWGEALLAQPLAH